MVSREGSYTDTGHYNCIEIHSSLDGNLFQGNNRIQSQHYNNNEASQSEYTDFAVLYTPPHIPCGLRVDSEESEDSPMMLRQTKTEGHSGNLPKP